MYVKNVYVQKQTSINIINNIIVIVNQRFNKPFRNIKILYIDIKCLNVIMS